MVGSPAAATSQPTPNFVKGAVGSVLTSAQPHVQSVVAKATPYVQSAVSNPRVQSVYHSGVVQRTIEKTGPYVTPVTSHPRVQKVTGAVGSYCASGTSDAHRVAKDVRSPRISGAPRVELSSKTMATPAPGSHMEEATTPRGKVSSVDGRPLVVKSNSAQEVVTDGAALPAAAAVERPRLVSSSALTAESSPAPATEKTAPKLIQGVVHRASPFVSSALSSAQPHVQSAVAKATPYVKSAVHNPRVQSVRHSGVMQRTIETAGPYVAPVASHPRVQSAVGAVKTYCRPVSMREIPTARSLIVSSDFDNSEAA